MLNDFGKLYKKCSVNLTGRDPGGLSLKKIQVGWHKEHGGLLRSYNIKISNGKKVLEIYHCKNQWIFLTKVSRVSTKQIDWTFFTLLSKILTHFWDRGGRICFLAHPIIPLITVAHLNYFYQNFHLKKTFTAICNKTYFSIWNF